MKAPRFRLRSVLVLIAVAAVVLAGVATLLRPPGRPHSSVFDGFDPSTLFAGRHYSGVHIRGGWNVSNAVAGYASREWRGVMGTANDPAVPQSIQKAIESYVDKVSRGKWLSEGKLTGDPAGTPQDSELPAHAVFEFNEQEWHCALHVWLFPDSSGSSYAYAIFLREERTP